MKGFLEPKATVPLEILSIRTKMDEAQVKKEDKEESPSQFGVPGF